MVDDRTTRRLRALYSLLLRLYPRAFRARFGESMRQTFGDLCRERRAHGHGLTGLVLHTFADTLTEILRQRIAQLMPPTRNLVRVALITAFLLTIPAVAMLLTGEVDWTLGDFFFAGVMIFGTGLTFEFVVARTRTSTYRLATAAALGTTFLLIWINLAVGIIGSEDNPANVLHMGVLLVFALGSVAAGLRARGMATAMFVTAAVQALVPFVALLIWRPLIGADAALVDLIRVIFLNTFFAVGYIAAGKLYRAADRDGDTPTPTGTDAPLPTH